MLVYHSRTKTLLCKFEDKIELFDFRKEKAKFTRKLKFEIKTAEDSLFMKFLKKLSIYDKHLGSFAYIVLHSKPPFANKIRLVFCTFANEKYFEIFRVREVEVDFGLKVPKKFF